MSLPPPRRHWSAHRIPGVDPRRPSRRQRTPGRPGVLDPPRSLQARRGGMWGVAPKASARGGPVCTGARGRDQQDVAARVEVPAPIPVCRLTALGCHQAPGYFLSRPAPPAVLDGWLQARQTRG
jgi:hypothetical protein